MGKVLLLVVKEFEHQARQNLCILNFSCKTHSREMAQTSGFYPMLKVKICFDCKMFYVANWVARLNGEDGLRVTPSHEALSVSPQGALEISSVIGSHLPWLESISAYLEWWQNPVNVMKGANLYPKDQRLGHALRASLYKRSVIKLERKGYTKMFWS